MCDFIVEFVTRVLKFENIYKFYFLIRSIEFIVNFLIIVYVCVCVLQSLN